ncbi:hypothetical protein PR048_030378 [Dryococelus australis]|uniref:Uncharacterized protein n=1 Tax=Dryococelus australis TaxID=614101 RepID=A0ABQ9G8U9_9NEOP|nr:hypothetical protein PR048_030378 [Dryococelus australis]
MASGFTSLGRYSLSAGVDRSLVRDHGLPDSSQLACGGEEKLTPLPPILSTSCSRIVAERLARSPPTKAIWVQFPGRITPDFRAWESCAEEAVVWRVFSGTSRFHLPLISALLHTHFNHPIGSQDLFVKSCPNLFTQSLLLAHSSFTEIKLIYVRAKRRILRAAASRLFFITLLQDPSRSRLAFNGFENCANEFLHAIKFLLAAVRDISTENESNAHQTGKIDIEAAKGAVVHYVACTPTWLFVSSARQVILSCSLPPIFVQYRTEREMASCPLAALSRSAFGHGREDKPIQGAFIYTRRISNNPPSLWSPPLGDPAFTDQLDSPSTHVPRVGMT